MAESLDEEMVATYAVEITGVKRTKSQMQSLDDAIRTLRETQYMPATAASERVTVSQARFGTSRGDKILRGKEDIFVAKVDALEGNVQTVAEKALAAGMAKGRKIQTAALLAAVTKQGLSGKPAKRQSAGRKVTGHMINSIATNVEVQKTKTVTTMLGWHGWARGREKYIGYQENGTKGRKSGQQPDALSRKVKKRRPDAASGRGIQAANSLGAAIIVVREQVKRELGKIKL